MLFHRGRSQSSEDRSANSKSGWSKFSATSVLLLLVALGSGMVHAAPLTSATLTVAPSQALTTFSSTTFNLPMSVSFDADWQVVEDYTDLVTVARKQEDWSVGFNIVTNAELADPVDGHRIPFPDDFVSWVKSNPDFIAGEATEVMVSGIKGLQIDATPMTTTRKDFLYLSGSQWNMIPAPEGWRFILLNDASGERLLITIIAPADQFEVAVELAQVVLDSVVFTNSAKVIAEWKMSMPMGFTFGFDSVWVPSHRSPNVTTRIDPSTNEVVEVIKGTGNRSHDSLAIGDFVWVTGESNDLAPIDPKTNTVGTAVQGSHPFIAYGFGSIWGATLTNGLDRIDPATSEIIASIEMGNGSNDCVNEALVTATAVWVYQCDEAELIKIDPDTNTILSRTSFDQLVSEATLQTTIPAGNGADFLWRVWDGGLLRLDPNTGAGLTYLPLNLAQLTDFPPPVVTDDAVWVSGYGQIARVNVATNQIDAIYEVHDGYAEVGVGFGSVWVSYWDENLFQRLDISP